MKQRKIAVILAGLLLLAGCGNSIKNEYGTYMAAPEAASGGASNAADTAAYDYDAEKNAEVTDEKLVYTADVTLQTRQYDDTVEKLHQAVKDAKGLIAQESQSVETHGSYKDGDGPKHLYITMRIPAEEFQAFLLKLDDLGNVISRNTYMENITRQYNDNSIEIEALQKQETRLLEMMDAAQTIEDMIAVETRLTEVQRDLNILLSHKNAMDTDIAYSTVSMQVNEVREYTEVHDDFLGRLGEGFVGGWKSFLRTGEDALIGLLYISPYILLVLAVVLLVKKTGWRITLPKRRKRDDVS